MDKIKEYNIKTPDWRESLRKNTRNTINVIILFVIIYLCVGFFIDVYLNFTPNIPLNITVMNLATLKIFPVATFLMLIVAAASLLIAYFFHESLVMLGTEYHEVTENSVETEERQLYNVVEELKIAAGLGFMPKVFIIDADYMNAFASGYSEKSAMVAITKGLMKKLSRDELQAVMAHELSHIRHNDIRLTLTILILSNLILIAIDIIFRGLLFSSQKGRDNRLVLVIIIARFVLPIITILLMLYISRTRELMADSGCVELMRNNEPLARALLKIDSDHKNHYDTYNRTYSGTAHEQIRNASYFYDPRYAGIAPLQSINDLFSTHPTLEKRLEALGIDKKDLS